MGTVEALIGVSDGWALIGASEAEALTGVSEGKTLMGHIRLKHCGGI